MSTAPFSDSRRLKLTLLTLAGVLLLTALTCGGSNAAVLHHRLTRGTIVWHAGRLSLSAELTVSPQCAPLAQTCWVQHPRRRPIYFSTWVYLSTPPNVPWQLSKWQLIVIPVGREEG
jgi:hypothetical protein